MNCDEEPTATFTFNSGYVGEVKVFKRLIDIDEFAKKCSQTTHLPQVAQLGKHLLDILDDESWDDAFQQVGYGVEFCLHDNIEDMVNDEMNYQVAKEEEAKIEQEASAEKSVASLKNKVAKAKSKAKQESEASVEDNANCVNAASDAEPNACDAESNESDAESNESDAEPNACDAESNKSDAEPNACDAEPDESGAEPNACDA